MPGELFGRQAFRMPWVSATELAGRKAALWLLVVVLLLVFFVFFLMRYLQGEIPRTVSPCSYLPKGLDGELWAADPSGTQGFCPNSAVGRPGGQADSGGVRSWGGMLVTLSLGCMCPWTSSCPGSTGWRHPKHILEAWKLQEISGIPGPSWPMLEEGWARWGAPGCLKLIQSHPGA